MIINYNSSGNWSLESVTSRYEILRSSIGGTSGFVLESRTYTNNGGITWIYNIMASVVDGVKLRDPACIQLSVEYIEANVMDSTTGYIRESLARILRHVDLTNDQKRRLARIFICQLEQKNIRKEFKEYIRLFKTIDIEPYRDQIAGFLTSDKAFIKRAAERLLS